MQFKVLSRVVEGQHEGFKTATMVLYMTNIIEILYKAPGFYKLQSLSFFRTVSRILQGICSLSNGKVHVRCWWNSRSDFGDESCYCHWSCWCFDFKMYVKLIWLNNLFIRHDTTYSYIQWFTRLWHANPFSSLRIVKNWRLWWMDWRYSVKEWFELYSLLINNQACIKKC